MDNDPSAAMVQVSSGRFTSFFTNRRMPRYGEAHHKRVPTPMKKRRTTPQPGHKAKPIPTDDPPTPSSENDEDDPLDTTASAPPNKDAKPLGVPDPYYPIYLPIDQAFKAKYVFHSRRGRSFQERVYVFLEHPCGWICFIYHFAV
ncbi:hypothetical protein WDU94_002511 [Cyamophila willieti]